MEIRIKHRYNSENGDRRVLPFIIKNRKIVLAKPIDDIPDMYAIYRETDYDKEWADNPHYNVIFSFKPDNAVYPTLLHYNLNPLDKIKLKIIWDDVLTRSTIIKDIIIPIVVGLICAVFGAVLTYVLACK